MGQLTREERHRVFLVQRKARRAMLAPMTSDPTVAPERRPSQLRLPWVLKMAITATLLAGGWIAYHAVEFHAPGSLLETVWPRL